MNGASTSSPGPNAPLGNLCDNSPLPQYSAEAAFSQWTDAGFPAGQLLLGLPLYGYVSQCTATALSYFVQPAEPIAGTQLEAYRQRVLGMAGRAPDTCPIQTKVGEHGSVPNLLKGAHPRARPNNRTGMIAAQDAGDLSSYWDQQIPFNQIVALGALQETSEGTFVQANGYTEGSCICPPEHHTCS